MVFTERDAGNTALWVAYGLGLFRRHDLEVTLAQEPDQVALDGLIAGQREIVVGNGAAALVAAAGGADLRFVAGLLNSFPYRLLVDPAIQAPADLGRPAGRRADRARRPTWRRAFAASRAGPGAGQGRAASAGERRPGAAGRARERGDPGRGGGAAEAVFLERLDFHSLLDFGSLDAEGPNRQVIVTPRLLDQQPALVQRFVDALVEGTVLAKRGSGAGAAGVSRYLHVGDEVALDETYDLFVRQLGLSPALPRPGKQY